MTFCLPGHVKISQNFTATLPKVYLFFNAVFAKLFPIFEQKLVLQPSKICSFSSVASGAHIIPQCPVIGVMFFRFFSSKDQTCYNMTVLHQDYSVNAATLSIQNL